MRHQAFRLTRYLFVLATASASWGQALSPIIDHPVTAPGLASHQLTAPLQDGLIRIDPTQDGWQTEAFEQAVKPTIKGLAQMLRTLKAPASLRDCPSTPLLPHASKKFFSTPLFSVSYRTVPQALTSTLHRELAGLNALFANGPSAHTKVVRVTPQPDHWLTEIEVDLSGQGAPTHRRQLVAHWEIRWDTHQPPRMQSARLLDATDTRLESSKPMFNDIGAEVFDHQPSLAEQRHRPTDYWRSRIPRDLGLDVVANHGIAVGDINNDDREDLYICQQGGLPNRLLVQQADGRFIDQAPAAGVDWLDYSASALILDFDNDGDRDLAVSLDNQLVLHANTGDGTFAAPIALPLEAQTFSMAAADFDNDGDLDLYTCGYNPSAGAKRTSAMGEPLPFHDARNGGANLLLRNDGNLRFTNATPGSGLDRDNHRFSFAAAWQDFDRDGDMDLYVANDYGPNNLFRNHLGRFTDVAATHGVTDQSAGMSVSWGDYNRDGHPDIHVSNMFSSAGRRITEQPQFKPQAAPHSRGAFQRFARGNSLFAGNGQEFTDQSEAAGILRGRWAWGSRFADLNNDGWEDLVVANGFVTASNSGDL